MVRIKHLTEVKSIKPNPNRPTITKGVIKFPVPYNAVDIEFDDKIIIQIERPLTEQKIITAYRAIPKKSFDGIIEGQDIVV